MAGRGTAVNAERRDFLLRAGGRLCPASEHMVRAGLEYRAAECRAWILIHETSSALSVRLAYQREVAGRTLPLDKLAPTRSSFRGKARRDLRHYCSITSILSNITLL